MGGSSAAPIVRVLRSLTVGSIFQCWLRRKSQLFHQVAPNQSIAAALQQMAHARVGAVLIVDPVSSGLRGILTERDVVWKMLCERSSSLVEATCADIGTALPQCVHPDTTALECIHRMLYGGFRHLPVVEREGSDRLAGMVSIYDLAKLATVVHEEATRARLEQTTLREVRQHLSAYDSLFPSADQLPQLRDPSAWAQRHVMWPGPPPHGLERGVLWLDADRTSLVQAARVMRAHRVGCMLAARVGSGSGSGSAAPVVAGILSERDLVRAAAGAGGSGGRGADALAGKGGDVDVDDAGPAPLTADADADGGDAPAGRFPSGDRPVALAMSTPVLFASETSTLWAGLNLLVRSNFRHLPVHVAGADDSSDAVLPPDAAAPTHGSAVEDGGPGGADPGVQWPWAAPPPHLPVSAFRLLSVRDLLAASVGELQAGSTRAQRRCRWRGGRGEREQSHKE